MGDRGYLLCHLHAGLDDASTLRELSARLVEIGVTPYYLHLLDRVRGTARIIDFKAGWGQRADRLELSSLPSIDEYAKQLGAYAAGVEAAGLRVESVGLVYAGIPAVAWLER